VDPSVKEFFELIYGNLPQSKFIFFTQILKSVQRAQPRFVSNIDELITAVKSLEANGQQDFYFSPAYYNRPTRPTKSNVHGSGFTWVDCDGTLPEFEETPTVLIQTSPGHFHAYWNLGSCHSSNDVESISRGLAYKYGTDKSGWDSTQLLRPPGSFNRKRDNFRSTIVGWNPHQVVDFSHFISSAPTVLPILQEGSLDRLFANLTFTQRVKDLIFDKTEARNGEGRSGVLYELACELVAMNLKDHDVSQLLIFTDKRLGKFQTRSDSERVISDLIKTVREKKGIAPPVEVEERPTFRLLTGMADTMKDSDVSESYVVDDFLPEQGIIMLAGDPGCGKSRFGTNMLLSVATGLPFIGRKVGRPRMSAFLSLDMPFPRLQTMLKTQLKGIPQEKHHLLEENLAIINLGHGLNLLDDKPRLEIESYIEEYVIEFLTIDAMSRTVSSVSDDKEVTALINWFQSLGINLCLISHTRKAPPATKNQNILDDLFGSRLWSVAPDVCLMLTRENQKREQKLITLKDRLDRLPYSMTIRKPRDTSLYEVISQEEFESGESDDNDEKLGPMDG